MWQDHRLAGNRTTATTSTEPGPSQNSSPHQVQAVNHKDYILNQGPAGKVYFNYSSLIPGLEQGKGKESAGYNPIALSSINPALNHIQLQQAAPVSPDQSISSSISASSCITSLSDQTGSFNTCQNIAHSSSDKNTKIMKNSATSGDIHHGEFGQDINNNVILNNNKLLEIKANMPATKDSDPSEPGHINQLNQADIAGSGGMISMSLNWPWTSMLLSGSSPGSTAAGRDQHVLQLNNMGGSRGMISDDDLHNLQDNFNWASSATRNVHQLDNSSTKVMDSESVNSSLNAGLVGAAGQPGGLWGQPVFSSPSSEVVQDLHDNLSCSTEDHGQLQDVLYPAAACTPVDHSLASFNRHPQLLRSSSYSLNSPCDDQYNANNSMLMSIRPGNSTDNPTNNATLAGQQWPISASTLLTPSQAGVQGQNINQLSHMINPVVKQEYQDMQVPLNWPPVLDQHQVKMHNSLNPLMSISAASDHRLACQNQINSNQSSMQAATNSLSANYLHQGALPAASIAGQHFQNPNIMNNPASLSYHHQHQHHNMRSAGAGLAATTLRQLQHPVDQINSINSNLKQAQLLRQHQLAQLMQSGGHKQRSCTPLDHRAGAGSMHHLDSQKAVASDLQDHHKASSNTHMATAAAMANFDESTTHHHHVAELQGSTAVYTQQLKRPRTASTGGDHHQHQAPAGSAPNSGPFKQTVRKEKLGDRITTLQQLVSPFGKTDTASVLLEAIRYIELLQDQIQVLSSPYMKNATTAGAAASSDPKEGGSDQQPRHDLRSKGLCLVPVSCTLHVASDNISGADSFWSAAFSGNLRS